MAENRSGRLLHDDDDDTNPVSSDYAALPHSEEPEEPLLPGRGDAVGVTAGSTFNLKSVPRAQWLLSVYQLFHFMSVFIVIPTVVPVVTDELFGGSTRDASVFLAILFCVSGGIEFGLSPVVGALSDQHGRVLPLVMLTAISAAGLVMLAISRTLVTFSLGAVIRGVTKSTGSVVSAMVVDTSPKSAAISGQFVGISASIAAGTILGAFAGAGLGTVNNQLPFTVAAALELGCAVYAWLAVPETLTTQRPFRLSDTVPFTNAALLVQSPSMKKLFSVWVLCIVAVSSYSQALIFFKYRFGFAAEQSGMFIGFVGILGVLGSILVLVVLLPRRSNRAIVLLALGCGSVHFLFLGLVTEPYHVYLSALPCLVWCGCLPVMLGCISRRCAWHEQGALHGALDGLTVVVNICGVLMMSGLYNCSEKYLSNKRGEGSFDPGIGLIFFVSSGLLLMAICVIRFAAGWTNDEDDCVMAPASIDGQDLAIETRYKAGLLSDDTQIRDDVEVPDFDERVDGGEPESAHHVISNPSWRVLTPEEIRERLGRAGLSGTEHRIEP